MHFVPASAFIDWSLVQPVFQDQPAAAAAAAGDEQHVDAAAATVDEQHDDHTGRGDQPAADAAAAGDEQPEAAAAAATGDEQHDDYTGRGHGRSGLEPKVIGLLVNLYRYNERECAETWSRVRASMDKLYNSRENIARQVDAALNRRKRSWD